MADIEPRHDESRGVSGWAVAGLVVAAVAAVGFAAWLLLDGLLGSDDSAGESAGTSTTTTIALLTTTTPPKVTTTEPAPVSTTTTLPVIDWVYVPRNGLYWSKNLVACFLWLPVFLRR